MAKFPIYLNRRVFVMILRLRGFTDTQAYLNLCRAHMSEGTFSGGAAHTCIL